MTVPQRDATALIVLGLVTLHPGSGYDLARLAEPSVGYLWRRRAARCARAR